ncbi:hypothetical protein EVAR_7915_1 [Eumeta japonica]|uniref:Uncharacterized protein n=1 Tax=Eumeta variegata TaxID=151549 RepID=A0A4C1TV64_EUMVA|nr:hypothetical protein EVAR_7915_1 [Eumeta japonica]
MDSWGDWDDEQIEDNSCDIFGIASNTDSINKNFFVYGVPPIQLSSCQAPSIPCSSAASLTKPTKLGAFTTSRPKVEPVHCSAEYERIRRVLKNYYARAKEHDLKCMSRYNRNSENLCCDTEPCYTANPEKGCCDDHVPC